MPRDTSLHCRLEQFAVLNGEAVQYEGEVTGRQEMDSLMEEIISNLSLSPILTPISDFKASRPFVTLLSKA